MKKMPFATERAGQLAKALEIWVALTGVDPKSRSFSIKMGGGMDDYTVHKMHDAIKEALALDPTNITAHLLLDAFSTRYFDSRSFSVSELLEKPDVTAKYIATANEFRALAKSPEITAIGEDFGLSMRQALRHYGADTKETMKVVADTHQLAYLRRDALRSIATLRVDQFLTGEREPLGVAPAYNAVVHRAWNINSLMNLACRLPSGVSLNLIQDPEEFHSYFAFTIRNGGNLFLLSDVPEHDHPLQRYMSRRPDRAFDERAGRNWFPYDLTNVKYDEETDRCYVDSADRRSLVPLQQEIDQLKRIADLRPEEAVWIVMMFDLIAERFWNKTYQAPALSYTGQMVREQSPLIDAARKSMLPVAAYQPLALPPLTVQSVSKDNFDKSTIGSDGGAPNDWLETRYIDRVGDEVVNLLSSTGTNHYLPRIAKAGGEVADHESALVLPGNIVAVDAKHDEELFDCDRKGRYYLHAMDVTSFGRREEIEANRIFLARHNLAKSIQRLADEEFNLRQADILMWWRKSVDENIGHIYAMATVLEAWRRIDKLRFPAAHIDAFGWHSSGQYQFMKRYTDEEWKSNRYYVSCKTGAALHRGYRKKGSVWQCHLNGAASSYRVLFQPQSADDLAYLIGASVADLPDVLQHWCRRRNTMATRFSIALIQWRGR